MKRAWILVIVLICATGIPISAAPWTEYRITTSPANQSVPDIEGSIVVWEDYRHSNTDIYAADIADPNNPVEFSVTTHENSEFSPALGGNFVFYTRRKYCSAHTASVEYGVYGYNLITHSTSEITPPCPLSSSGGTGGKVSGADESTVVWIRSQWVKGYDIETDSLFEVSYTYASTQQASSLSADVSHNIVVWTDNRNDNFDIYGFDIATWQNFPITINSGWQEHPAISQNIVVWEDYRHSNTDIYGADISDRYNPVEFPICIDANEQRAPAISGNIVVWEDNRNGNWDIYGYDISTQTEFQITDNPADQEYPDISGHTVVWEDKRDGQSDIYATILYGPIVPRCTSPVQGDINGDCKVNFTDLALMLNNWLDCNLDPPEACWQ